MAKQILLTLEDKIDKKLEIYCKKINLSKNNAINILLEGALK